MRLLTKLHILDWLGGDFMLKNFLKYLFSLIMCFAIVFSFVSCDKNDISSKTQNILADENINITSHKFNTQYARTNKASYDNTDPETVIIRSKEELENYYNSNKTLYNFERGDDYGKSFLEIYKKYDNNYFENQILILLSIVADSGSPRYSINELKTINENNVTKTKIDIARIIPGDITADLAAWHIFLEPERDFKIENPENIEITISDVYYRQNGSKASNFKTFSNNTQSSSKIKAHCFSTQYVRTDGGFDLDYPKAVIIRSEEEYEKYYNENKEIYDFNNSQDSSTPLYVADNIYDKNYFKSKILVVLLIKSVGNKTRPAVTTVETTQENGKSTGEINVINLIPNNQSDDNPCLWHVFIEIEENFDIRDAADIKINSKDIPCVCIAERIVGIGNID